MDIDDTSLIRAGNERVLRARLSDAAFFFQSDTKRDFSTLTEKLEGIVFQEKLGTVLDKVKRLREICAWLAPRLDYDARVTEDADRAAKLCKNDLLTEMVCEFPNLQGVMGKEYARSSGEDEAVAVAIYEHYLPRHQEDVYPQSPAGIVLSIADKIDTICGCFGVGLLPTGSTDPYALRRQTLGIIGILLEHEKHLNLEELVDTSLRCLGEVVKNPEGTKTAVLDFFKTRMDTLFNVLPGYGTRYDLVEAVLTHHCRDVPDAGMRIKALSQMCREDYFEPLITSFKRVVRIIPHEAWDYDFSPDKLIEPAEKALWESFNKIKEETDLLLKNRKYNAAMKNIAGLRSEVDRFFDEVLVMAKEEEVKKNRLALLVQLASFFRHIADFSRIVVENEKTGGNPKSTVKFEQT
jgi:glycyl-tRNA synthetase beta chain